MRPDHYATLGVEPSASAAEIRAAYLKLLREFHPDRNRSPHAAERTQGIIAAFKVLSNFDQRSYYDWDRRRDREAAEAEAAAAAPRWNQRAKVAAGGIGLAALGAWMLMPGATPKQPTDMPTTASVDPERQPAAPIRTAAAKPVAERKGRRVTVIRMRPALPEAAKAKAVERVARNDPPKAAPSKVAPKPNVRVAAVAPAPRPKENVVQPPPPVRVAAKPPPPVRVAEKLAPPVRVAAKAVPSPARSRPSSARAITDLASLDQFVMNFYGQSWRYGDAPKRAVLEQTRAGFVVRRGACVADACKRDAYLKLMRDVSAIVETGQPKSR